jgi:hypothetical protein
MLRFIATALGAAFVLLSFNSGASADLLNCTQPYIWQCIGSGTSSAPPTKINMQSIVADRTAVKYQPDDLKNANYVDLTISCNAGGVEAFARQFVDRAWNAGLLSSDRELVLTADIERVLGGGQAPAAVTTYIVAQVKRAAAGDTTITGCDDTIATNLPANTEFRLKFKLLQSKTTTISPATYSAFKLLSSVIGFVVAGPAGTALASKIGDISTKVKDSKSDIDAIVSLFDDVNTDKPQLTLDVNDKATTFTLSDKSKFVINRRVKRSVFLTFSGDTVNAPGAPLEKSISDGTGISLSSYLQQKAGNWNTMLTSTAAETAATGCTTIRTALLAMFTEEESAVILARLIDGFGSTTIAAMKEPCLNGSERVALKKMGVTDPLPAPQTPPSTTPPPDITETQTQTRLSALKDFLGQFGRLLIAQANPNRDKAKEAQKIGLYLDDRVVTQSFDASDLLPSGDGVPRETLAAKLVSWPFGAAVRFGCFLPPSKLLAPKYSAQFLLELNSGTASAVLLNVITGYPDNPIASASDLKIRYLLLEHATSGSLQAYKDAYKDGCGDRSDPWKPWEPKSGPQARATHPGPVFADGISPDKIRLQ